MLLTPGDHTVQTLTADGSHQPFTMGIGLGRLPGCSQDVQPECLQIIVDFRREDRIPIMNQESVAVIGGNSNRAIGQVVDSTVAQCFDDGQVLILG